VAEILLFRAFTFSGERVRVPWAMPVPYPPEIGATVQLPSYGELNGAGSTGPGGCGVARLSEGMCLAGHLGRTGQWFGKVIYRKFIGEVSRSGVQSVRSVQRAILGRREKIKRLTLERREEENLGNAA
jgi:hypothetical protein